MSLFGKILSVLNLLAALAFFIIAGMDYQARNAWTYHVFRFQLAIHGLPLDDTDDSWRVGRAIVRDVNRKTLDDLFSRAGGQPVKTQLEAVEQAKASAVQAIDSQNNDNDKRAAAKAIWQRLAVHTTQREKIAEFCKTLPIPDLTAAVGKQFDDITEDLKKPTDPKLPDNQRRASAELRRTQVADLLYNYASDASSRDRCLAVVGLNAFVAAADRQTANLNGQIVGLTLRLKDESALFARQYHELLPKLVLLNDELKADKIRLDQQLKILEQHKLLFEARTAERNDLREQLRKTGDQAVAETNSLATLQKQLFDLQREIAGAREENEKLESQIRTKELGK